MSINNLDANLFKPYFDAYPQINGRYEMCSVLNLDAPNLTYPRVFIIPERSVPQNNVVVHTLTIICADKVELENNSQIKSTWSDTEQILTDLVKFIRNYNDWFDITNNPQISRFLDQYADRYTGSVMVMELQVDASVGLCDVPLFDPAICGYVNISAQIPGPTGSAGVQGFQGPRGLQGVQGFQGSGIQGDIGNTGPQGNVGDIGPQGFQGQIGSGVQGFQGFQGFQGLQGRQGLQGIQGVFGTTGVQGFQGLGNIGTTGLQGVQGWQGISGSETTLVAVTSSDFNTTSTSYVSVTGASVSLAANTNYNIRVIGDWSSNNNSGQATFGITVPAGTSFTMIRMMGVASSAVTTNMQNTPDQSSLGAIGVGGSIRPFTMNIKLSTAGTAGAFQLRIASNNASYTATCTKNTLIEAKPY